MSSVICENMVSEHRDFRLPNGGIVRGIRLANEWRLDPSLLCVILKIDRLADELPEEELGVLYRFGEEDDSVLRCVSKAVEPQVTLSIRAVVFLCSRLCVPEPRCHRAGTLYLYWLPKLEKETGVNCHPVGLTDLLRHLPVSRLYLENLIGSCAFDGRYCPRVASTQMAECFGLEHEDVLAAIDSTLTQKSKAFRASNSREFNYPDGWGDWKDPVRGWLLTREAFTLVARNWTSDRDKEVRKHILATLARKQQELDAEEKFGASSPLQRSAYLH